MVTLTCLPFSINAQSENPCFLLKSTLKIKVYKIFILNKLILNTDFNFLNHKQIEPKITVGPKHLLTSYGFGRDSSLPTVKLFLVTLLLLSSTAVNAQYLEHFDAQSYMKFHPDVAAVYGPTNWAGARQHFFAYGIYEGRRPSLEFDPRFYLRANPDVARAFGSTNYRLAFIHWVLYGINEGRQSSEEFDVRHYLLEHSNLVSAYGSTNYKAALNNFRRWGLGQGRETSENFDVGFYLKNYSDLRSTFGTSGVSYLRAFRHRITHGQSRRGIAPKKLDVSHVNNTVRGFNGQAVLARFRVTKLIGGRDVPVRKGKFKLFRLNSDGSLGTQLGRGRTKDDKIRRPNNDGVVVFSIDVGQEEYKVRAVYSRKRRRKPRERLTIDALIKPIRAKISASANSFCQVSSSSIRLNFTVTATEIDSSGNVIGPLVNFPVAGKIRGVGGGVIGPQIGGSEPIDDPSKRPKTNSEGHANFSFFVNINLFYDRGPTIIPVGFIGWERDNGRFGEGVSGEGSRRTPSVGSCRP